MQRTQKRYRPNSTSTTNCSTRKIRRSQRPSKMDVGVRPPKDYPWRVLDRLTTGLAQWLDGSEAEELHGIIRSRDFSRYLELSERWGLQSINRNAEPYSPGMASRLLLCAVIRKYPFEGMAKSKRDAALRNVKQTNVSCGEFNRSLWKHLFISGHPCTELTLMREFVMKVVGLTPPDGGAMTDRSRHGPGSDTGTLLGFISSYDKYSEWPYHVTPLARERATELIRQDERWFGALEDSYRERNHIPMWSILDWHTFWDEVFLTKDHNRITTVPKDYLKDRPIAIEPRLNLMLQLGVDGFIRSRLKRWGINLDSQLKNQMMARDGSIRSDADTPVTIDLSNASDTISLRLVKLLFPEDWYRLLCALRAPKGSLPGGIDLRYSKISSMGNGYTFALESLIFGAACYAAMKMVYGRWDADMVAVYGDDMIVPQAACAPLLNLLSLCGFTVNEPKSFLKGTVRESCGTDWVAGVNVRPVYMKDVPSTVDILYAHRNLLMRWGHLFIGHTIPGMNELFDQWIPEHLRVYGPISDEEFSSYLHSEERGQFDNWSYHHMYLSVRATGRSGNNFLFRKLMHDLSPHDEETWNQTGYSCSLSERLKKRTGGSRFTITTRDRVAYKMRVRRIPFWTSEYSMSLTGKATA